MDNTKTVISLCSGYEGIGMGLKRVIPSLRTIAYVEIEAFAISNLVAKMEEGKLDVSPVWTNLKTFSGKQFRDKVHLLTGGYPCQPFSAAGQRKGKEDPRHLWPYIKEIVRTVRPVQCFFENVEGHISLGLREVIEDLGELGYETTWGIFSAVEVGAPHQRKRVFILGDSESGREYHRNTWAPISRETGTNELPHANGKGLQGCQCTGRTDEKGRQKQVASASQCGDLWPSRPTEFQHEWEPPRVVGNSKSEGYKERVQPKTVGKLNAQRQTQSSMGGDSDGYPDWMVRSTSRVNELRLLGNGVVPATAAKAYRCLDERLDI